VLLEGTMTLVRDVEYRTALPEREARERLSRVEAMSDVALASAHEEAEGLARRITLLVCEVAEAH
jgi:hypothetical protein